MAIGLLEGDENAPVKLPPKTHSYMVWAQTLIDYSSSRQLLEELPYWQNLTGSGYRELQPERSLQAEADTHAFCKTAGFQLQAGVTERLLADVHNAYHTTINDILLAAVAIALCNWLGRREVGILLEGHGREQVSPGLDITRTIGWFTSRFPVVLAVNDPNDPGATVKAVKETLRKVPNNGIGYGILRYLTPRRLRGGSLEGPEPAVAFNYLGQVGEEADGEFEFRPLPAEQSRHRNQERTSVLEIDGLVQSGRLYLTVSYHSAQFDAQRIDALLVELESSLQTIIRHCCQQEDQEFTLSDFSDDSIDEEDLDAIIGELEM